MWQAARAGQRKRLAVWLKHRTRSHRIHAHTLVRPRTFLCGPGEKKVQLCSASYSFLCQMGRIRVTCSVDTLQATNELMPQKILDIVEMWSLEGTISSASYNNCTCGNFHSLLWECSNEGRRKRKSCGSGLRYNDRIMRRTREDKRNTLLTPLMQDSGGHRLCTDQAYILCYSILFYFSPSFFPVSLLQTTTIPLASVLQIHGAQQGA